MPSNSTSWDPWASPAKAYCESLNESTQAKLDDWSSEFTSMMVGFHVYYYIIIVSGTTGNSLVIYIYGRKTHRTTAAQCILFLGVTDLFISLVITTLALHEVYFKFSAFNEALCIFHEYVHHTSLAISCITLGCIALDRYIAICKPLHYAMHVHRAKYMIMLELFVACVIEIPIIFLAGLERAELPDGLLGCVCYWKEEYAGTYVYLIFQTCMMSLQMSLAICICILYSFVYKVVKEREKKRRQGACFGLGGESVNGTHGVTGCNITMGPGIRDINVSGVTGNTGVLEDRDARKKSHNNPSVASAVAREDCSDQGQQKHMPSSNKTDKPFTLGMTHAVNVLEAVREDSRGEQEIQTSEQPPSTSNCSSSLHPVSESGSRMIHHRDGKDRVSESPDVNQRPREVPAEGDPGRAFSARRAWNVLLHVTRIHPHERLDQRTVNMFQERANARLRNRYKTAQMLVLVTAIFFITWIPYWVITLYVYLQPEFYKEKAAWELNLIKILRHLYLVNNATNPIIYTFVNKQFRDEVKQVFLCKKCHKQ